MPKCNLCQSSDYVVKSGMRHNKSMDKQMYWCKRCNHRFTPNDGFLRMRKPKEIIVEAVSLYIDGLSLSKVQKHLWQHHGVKVSRWAILKWVRKYSRLLQEFADELRPKIKGDIHADEVIVKVKGEKNWDWGAIDKKTKYKFSGDLTKKRTKNGAIRLFQKIKNRGDGEPKKIITDKLGHYRIAYNKVFYRRKKPRPELVHGVPIACRKYGLEHNNNPIERDNERIKQRYKTTRGFKNNSFAEDTIKLMDIFHNFIDPHMSLKGKTPAEMAEIDLKLGRNKLLGLIFFLS
jgi:transposase-like protein